MATVFAAGALVWCEESEGVDPRVLIIHRNVYDDFSLPKGKVEAGETLPAAGQREVLEETGLDIQLGPSLGVSQYLVEAGREKTVYYWAAKVSEPTELVPNAEADYGLWTKAKVAAEKLTYPSERKIVDRFLRMRQRGLIAQTTLLVLRHAEAESSASSDMDRRLSPRGRLQAQSLTRVLSAWKPKRLFSSPATRCLQTLGPYAKILGKSPEIYAGLYPGQPDPDKPLNLALEARERCLIVTHAPVLQPLLGRLAKLSQSPELVNFSLIPPGSFVVINLSSSLAVCTAEIHGSESPVRA